MFLRRIVPGTVRRALRGMQQDRILRRALNQFAGDPARSSRDMDLLGELVRGWSNEGFSAKPEYLSAIAQAALESSGSILECGSGLSTLLLSACARQSGARIWALEHTPNWAARVRRELRRLESSPNTNVVDAPLRAYSGFSWYDVTRLPAAEIFSVVVCDGPPAETKGGRYGLLPVLAHRLAVGAEIFMDDAARPDEQSIMRRWVSESGGSFTIAGNEKPYAVFTPSRKYASNERTAEAAAR